MNSSRVVIAGGGSGGHVFPALAIAEGLVELGIHQSDITFFGSRRTLEKEIIPASGFRLITFTGRGLNKKDFLQNILNFAGLFLACMKAVYLLLRHRPEVVIGVGGYASVPALFAATLLGITRVVHEQNAYLGRTNRLAQKMGATVLTTFENTEGTTNAVLVGLPMSDSIDEAIRSREKFLSSPGEKKTVLIAGGSLGSLAINKAVEGLLTSHAADIDFEIVQICGAHHIDQIRQRYLELGVEDQITLYSFRDDIRILYAQSDCVVGRAGAGTCVELETLGVQCVLVPLPNAPGDHQRLNAASLIESGQCVLLDQSALNASTLLIAIKNALENPISTEPNLYHLGARRRIATYLGESFLLTETESEKKHGER